jgi:hypothetical protein
MHGTNAWLAQYKRNQDPETKQMERTSGPSVSFLGYLRITMVARLKGNDRLRRWAW